MVQQVTSQSERNVRGRVEKKGEKRKSASEPAPERERERKREKERERKKVQKMIPFHRVLSPRPPSKSDRQTYHF